MQSNRLQLNTNKSELLWCATARRRHQLPSYPFMIGPDTIIPSTAVRDLGICIDSDLSMQVHVQRSVAGCFAVLRQLRSIQRFVPSSVYQSLVVALVLSRMDYGNATLAGLRPACLTISSPSSMRQLGRSPVSVARSILQMLSPVSTDFEHPSASSSNWWSFCTELFTALHLSIYWARFSTSPICRRDIKAGCARRPPVSLTSVCRNLLLSAIVRLLLPARDSGTVFLSTSSLPCHSQHFVRN